MIEKYLPVGSVVLLKGGKKRIVIIGRREQEKAAGGRSWDYLACPYPEGFMGEDLAFLFDHEQIERVFFIGFQDGEELAFRERLASGDPHPPSGTGP